jgi:hypothetical protein
MKSRCVLLAVLSLALLPLGCDKKSESKNDAKGGGTASGHAGMAPAAPRVQAGPGQAGPGAAAPQGGPAGGHGLANNTPPANNLPPGNDPAGGRGFNRPGARGTLPNSGPAGNPMNVAGGPRAGHGNAGQYPAPTKFAGGAVPAGYGTNGVQGGNRAPAAPMTESPNGFPRPNGNPGGATPPPGIGFKTGQGGAAPPAAAGHGAFPQPNGAGRGTLPPAGPRGAQGAIPGANGNTHPPAGRGTLEGFGRGGRGGPGGLGRGVPGGPAGGVRNGPGGGPQSGQPPQKPEGSVENAAIQFVVKLTAKDYKGMRKYVSSKAAGRLRGFAGKGKPSESDLEYLHALLGRVKVLKDETFKRAGGDRSYYLVNDHGRQIEFRCHKEGSAYVIRRLEVSKASGAIGQQRSSGTSGRGGRGRRRR